MLAQSRTILLAGLVVFVVALGGGGYAWYALRQADPGNGAPTTPTPAEPTPASRDMERYSHVTSLKIALGSYLARVNAYPASLDQLVPADLPAVPLDPGTNQPYAYELVDDAYRVSFVLEQGALGLSAGPHFLTPNGFDVAPVRPPTAEAEIRPPAIVPGDGGPPVAQEPPASPFPNGTPDDTDADGLTNDAEVRVFFTDPSNPDSDGDGVDDITELRLGRDPAKPGTLLPDTDGDRLPDVYETHLGISPDSADTDADTLADDQELLIYGSDPTVADTDGDGFTDGQEVGGGYDPIGPGHPTDERLRQYEERRTTYQR